MDPSEVLRSAYRELTEDEMAAILNLKHLGELFVGRCDAYGESRELSIAKTKMEEAVMWAVKAISK